MAQGRPDQIFVAVQSFMDSRDYPDRAYSGYMLCQLLVKNASLSLGYLCFLLLHVLILCTQYRVICFAIVFIIRVIEN